MRHATSEVEIYLNKLNLIIPTSGGNIPKNFTFCGPAISRLSGVLHAFMNGNVL